MQALVVDDSSSIRLALRLLLEDLGYLVREAEDGAAGLRLLRGSEVFDVCFVDWNMPTMDGIEMLKHWAEGEPKHGPPVMMVTSESDLDHIREAMAAGAAEYLIKPFDQEAIRTKLELLGLFQGKPTKA